MGVKKSVEEVLILDGSIEELMNVCTKSLERADFSRIEVNKDLHQITAAHRKFTVWGTISIILSPENANTTKLSITATANVDNAFALFKNPGKEIIGAFKNNI